MAERKDLFDEEDVKPQKVGASSPTRGGLSRPISRRAFLGGAAAGGAAGVAATAGVFTLVGGPPGGVADVVAPGRPAVTGEPLVGRVVTLNVNGRDHEVFVKANETLLEVLRRQLGLTGPKLGCDRSECSACTVLVDGVAMNSCSLLAIREAGKKIVTIEGLEQDGKLHPVQDAFMEHMGFQCGFCTPGQIMQAVALLQRIPKPTEAQVRRAMSGNLCKCSAYPNIMAAVISAAQKTGAA